MVNVPLMMHSPIGTSQVSATLPLPILCPLLLLCKDGSSPLQLNSILTSPKRKRGPPSLTLRAGQQFSCNAPVGTVISIGLDYVSFLKSTSERRPLRS